MKNNILITSAGRRVSLVKAFQKELKDIFPESKVITTDNAPNLSAACQVSDKSFSICKIIDESYISELLQLCETNEIKLIVPTLDTELQILVNNLQKFRNQTIIISNSNFIKICRDKRLTNNFFIENGIQIPLQYNKENYQFPLFIKPYNGSLSADIHLINNVDELQDKFIYDDKYMFMEYLSPHDYDEYTVDMYYDKNSNLKCIVPRKRIEVRGGEISKGQTKKNIIITYISEKLKFIEGVKGCITLQVFLNKTTNDIYGIEINPRFGGGYPLSYAAGANFPKFIIQEYILNKEIEYFNDWKDGMMMLRYDEAIFI